MERSLAWVSRYRRLNTVFERIEAHLVAFIETAFISILSRRLVRLTPSKSAFDVYKQTLRATSGFNQKDVIILEDLFYADWLAHFSSSLAAIVDQKPVIPISISKKGEFRNENLNIGCLNKNNQLGLCISF